MNKVLVTGGSGYIGSHVVLSLIESDYEVVILDNLSNSNKISLERVSDICGVKPKFYEGDITDSKFLNFVFSQESIESVIHLAGLKSVSESVEEPLKYYKNNVYGSLQLFMAMKSFDIKKVVFSSSATIYGAPSELPLKETSDKQIPSNPYGITKSIIENMLEGIYSSNEEWGIINLRYFNPVGAHKSGKLGEDSKGIPNNIMPYISQTALGKFPKVLIFGNDYDTPDGTGVRDYVHVIDLAKAHVKALQKINQTHGQFNVNIGTGKGYSVLELIKEFKQVSKADIPYEITSRRAGDIAEVYADSSYAYDLLGWKAEMGLTEMCNDTWNWQKNNPNGYV